MAGDAGGEFFRLVDQVALRRAGALFEEVLLEDLDMAGLGVDDGLAELDEDVLHETAGEDEASYPENDRRQRHAAADLLTQGVSEGEL